MTRPPQCSEDLRMEKLMFEHGGGLADGACIVDGERRTSLVALLVACMIRLSKLSEIRQCQLIRSLRYPSRQGSKGIKCSSLQMATCASQQIKNAGLSNPKWSKRSPPPSRPEGIKLSAPTHTRRSRHTVLSLPRRKVWK